MRPTVDRAVAVSAGSDRGRCAPNGFSVSPYRANFGGEGASIAEVADVCYALGRACASTAMIFAMHQTKVACIVRHGQGSAWHQLLLRRLAGEQLLLASSTTEGQSGGDVRNSSAPIERNGSRISLERQATVISYGRAADGIVTTARRSADAASSDQVLVAFLKHDYTLEPVSGWDAFGMRGTCSEGFKLTASGAERADFAGRLRQDSRPDHDAGRASAAGARPGRASPPPR